MPNPFHLAIPVNDLAKARAFYGDLLGCPEGRSSDRWIDFNFFGHQLVCHLSETSTDQNPISNPVDGHDVPVPHFGIVLDMPDWRALADKLIAANTAFVIVSQNDFTFDTGVFRSSEMPATEMFDLPAEANGWIAFSI